MLRRDKMTKTEKNLMISLVGEGQVSSFMIFLSVVVLTIMAAIIYSLYTSNSIPLLALALTDPYSLILMFTESGYRDLLMAYLVYASFITLLGLCSSWRNAITRSSLKEIIIKGLRLGTAEGLVIMLMTLVIGILELVYIISQPADPRAWWPVWIYVFIIPIRMLIYATIVLVSIILINVISAFAGGVIAKRVVRR
jgi:hypothetical protein